jgi:hypothetical protein
MKKYLFVLLVFILSTSAEARPEYAARLGINSCQTCHYNPAGSSLRNPNGKLYGWRAREGVWDGERKYWHIDIRMNGLYPNRPDENNNGLALMSAVAGVSLPIEQLADKIKTQIVLTYDMGTVAANGPRDAYLQFISEDKGTWTLGRFLAPFGLLTDEHRAFTRLQTKTTIYDFEMGGMFSYDFNPRWHLDVALTSGFAQGGKFTGGNNAAPEQTSAVIINTRVSPTAYPGFIGISYRNDQSLIVKDVQAASVYSGISLERTRWFIPLHILTEIVWAQGWNNQKYNGMNMGQFIPGSDMALQTALEKSSSLAAGAEVNYELSPWWVLQYRYDRMALDQGYSGDVFQRHGVGFKHFFTATTNLLVRYEKAESSVKEIPPESVRANKDSFYLILHAWL